MTSWRSSARRSTERIGEARRAPGARPLLPAFKETTLSPHPEERALARVARDEAAGGSSRASWFETHASRAPHHEGLTPPGLLTFARPSPVNTLSSPAR